MAKKIYPNEPCPCGSQKKYKNCCGAPKKSSYNRCPKPAEDFVLNKLDEDLVMISNLMQVLLGPYGYDYCKRNSEYLNREYMRDGFISFTKKDEIKLFEMKQESQTFKTLRSYGGSIIENVYDVLTLKENGFICAEGRQVELFHAYLLQNIKNRFDEYLYVPDENIVKQGFAFGPFAHRGFDFLLGITVYLEIQLGIHIYLGENKQRTDFAQAKKLIRDVFLMPEHWELSAGMVQLLMDYLLAIGDGTYKYTLEKDVDLYNSLGVYSSELYKEYKKLCMPGVFKVPYENNYPKYLIFVVAATIFNNPGFYAIAQQSFMQCDFIRYIIGLENVVELFGDKSDKYISPDDFPVSEEAKKYAENEGIELHFEPFTMSIKEQYHSTVFNLLDELNGMTAHVLPDDLEYIDFADINDDDFTVNDGKRNINPARKSTNVQQVRKLKMEIYDFLNGKCFYFPLGEAPGSDKNSHYVGKYPILPWISNGKEDTNHIERNWHESYPLDTIYSRDIVKRQEYLNMEYRLTEIPVNCIYEFLNPDVFYNWKEKHDLLKEVQRKNELLEQKNEQLQRHIQLNQELIRNLSHSSSNYLNADNLLQTGKILRVAQEGNPTVETLHSNGLSLILQSEQEEHLLRQLNSLVWRCSADSDYLTDKIRKGLTKEGNLTIKAPVEFALRTIASRVLFREKDIRSQFIRNKLKKTDAEWDNLKSTFVFSVLATERQSATNMIAWWNEYICKLKIDYSPIWEKLHIIEDRSFFDLVTEIISEQIFNALSHGDLNFGIELVLGQAEEFRGRPKWAFISCENTIAQSYGGGRQAGISTLNESIALLNSGKRAIDVNKSKDTYSLKVWLLSSLLKPAS